MLEAFFTRERQRSIAIILSALTCIIWIGHFQTTRPATSQTSQTNDPTIAETAVTPATNQTYKRAEPLVDTTTGTSATEAPKPATDAVQPSAAPSFTITDQRIERTELSNSVVYDFYYKLVPSGNFGTPAIKTVLTGNRNCNEIATASYRYTDNGEQVVRCSLTAADMSADSTNPAQFKLDITADTVSINQTINYQWLPATAKP